MRLFILGMAGLASLATGEVALAQIGNQFRLDLSLVARRGDPATGIEDINGPVNILPGERVRIELRYRIADLVANNVASRGLAAALITIGNDRGDSAGSVEKSTLTDAQLNPGVFSPISNGVLNPDTSGQSDAANTGMVEPFRGFATNQSGFNGALFNGPGQPFGTPGIRLGGHGFVIIPQVLAAPNHQGWAGPLSTNITAANTNTNPAVWALYSFDYVSNPSFTGSITFTTGSDPDPQSGNTFAFFTRTGTTNNPSPISAAAMTHAALTINVVPGPGAGAVLVVSAVTMVRQRRRA